MIKTFFTGLQYAGVELQKTVQKLRNPLMNPNYVISSLWQRRQQAADKPTLNLGLEGYLHPSLHVSKFTHFISILLLSFCITLCFPYKWKTWKGKNDKKC